MLSKCGNSCTGVTSTPTGWIFFYDEPLKWPAMGPGLCKGIPSKEIRQDFVLTFLHSLCGLNISHKVSGSIEVTIYGDFSHTMLPKKTKWKFLILWLRMFHNVTFAIICWSNDCQSQPLFKGRRIASLNRGQAQEWQKILFLWRLENEFIMQNGLQWKHHGLAILTSGVLRELASHVSTGLLHSVHETSEKSLCMPDLRT